MELVVRNVKGEHRAVRDEVARDDTSEGTTSDIEGRNFASRCGAVRQCVAVQGRHVGDGKGSQHGRAEEARIDGSSERQTVQAESRQFRVRRDCKRRNRSSETRDILYNKIRQGGRINDGLRNRTCVVGEVRHLKPISSVGEDSGEDSGPGKIVESDRFKRGHAAPIARDGDGGSRSGVEVGKVQREGNEREFGIGEQSKRNGTVPDAVGDGNVNHGRGIEEFGGKRIFRSKVVTVEVDHEGVLIEEYTRVPRGNGAARSEFEGRGSQQVHGAPRRGDGAGKSRVDDLKGAHSGKCAPAGG